ncbi:MAG: ribonuclease III [Candidatus Melainabacteria bacterium]|nr:MAG: ribonuclease III [Candidatus Melainabacteria bacterium]
MSSIREYAYIGDAVWELFVREENIKSELKSEMLHKKTTEHVNAKFQHDMLRVIEDKLTAEEQEIERRGRNLSVPTGRRKIQSDYRQATAFEALIGYWYIENKNRLEEFKEILKKYL